MKFTKSARAGGLLLLFAGLALLEGCQKRDDRSVTSSSGASASTQSVVRVKGGVQ
jgi:hypothetical protein